jgi:fatty-acyl-CoA synthase
MALNWLESSPYGILETRARIFPDAEAIVTYAVGSDSLKVTTYGELHRGSVETARRLWAVGARPGARVAVWGENSLEWLEAWFALSHLGAVTVPINTRLTAHEVATILEVSGADLVLVGSQVQGQAEELASTAGVSYRQYSLRSLRELPPVASSDQQFTPPEVDGSRVGMFQFTSGSTGLPKPAKTLEGAMAAVGGANASRWLLRTSDRLFLVLPLYHNGGSIFATLAALAAGSSVVLTQGWAGGAAAAALESSGATIMPAVDTMVIDLLAAKIRPPKLRLVATAVNTTTCRRVAEELDIEVANTYGMSEATATVATGDLRDPRTVRIETIGRPHAGLEVRIVHGDGTSTSPGVQGEIQIRGWSVMPGYADRGPDQQPFTEDGWLKSGDIGVLDERGYLKFLGRTKDTIRSGGEQISALEVEAVLEGHERVLQAAVVAVKDSRFGEVPFAFIRTRQGSSLEINDLRAHCSVRLAKFKVPRYFEFVDEFPMTGNHKVAKIVLREMAARQLAGE